jgi:hypothetical protein
MSDYLVAGGWSGRQKIPVNIIGETPDGIEIKVLESVFLPGGGELKDGKSTCVPKGSVMIERTGKLKTGDT